MVCFGELRILLKFLDQAIVSERLLNPKPGEKRHEEKHRNDGNIVRRRGDLPQLVPIFNGQHCEDDEEYQHPESYQLAFTKVESALRHILKLTYFFFTAFISDSSITGAGPEMPPSFRIRQKWTAIKIEATNGIPMQCQM